LWDVLTSQEAVDIVQAHKHLGATEAVRELVHTAYDAGSYDNISAIVVLLVKPPPGPPKDEVTVAMPAPTKFARQSTFLDSAKQK
jgi:serine/threonine protein phosphatase PrpC